MPRSRLLWFGSLAFRLIVALAFGVASLLKMRAPGTFAEQTANYQFFPELANFIAVALPSVELVCALSLLLAPQLWRRAASVILFGMLVVFTAAIARAWALGINLECGCFGVGSTPIGPWPILRNLGLMTALLLGNWTEAKETQSPQPT